MVSHWRRGPRPQAIPISVALIFASLLIAGPPSSSPLARPAADETTPLPTTQPATTQPTTAAPRVAEARLVTGLVGSKHDFRQLNESVRDLCLPCHTPHVASAPPPRLDGRETVTRPLQPYEGFDVELTGWSLLCLGCHDGVTAQDVYSSAHAITVADQLANSRLGTPGLRSHPVGNLYPTNRADYHAVASVEAIGLPLPDGRIQCATCHDAHNTEHHVGMLRISNERSRLCLTCHRQ